MSKEILSNLQKNKDSWWNQSFLKIVDTFELRIFLLRKTKYWVNSISVRATSVLVAVYKIQTVIFKIMKLHTYTQIKKELNKPATQDWDDRFFVLAFEWKKFEDTDFMVVYHRHCL